VSDSATALSCVLTSVGFGNFALIVLMFRDPELSSLNLSRRDNRGFDAELRRFVCVREVGIYSDGS
jgi:hypothetical protein